MGGFSSALKREIFYTREAGPFEDAQDDRRRGGGGWGGGGGVVVHIHEDLTPDMLERGERQRGQA